MYDVISFGLTQILIRFSVEILSELSELHHLNTVAYSESGYVIYSPILLYKFHCDFSIELWVYKPWYIDKWPWYIDKCHEYPQKHISSLKEKKEGEKGEKKKKKKKSAGVRKGMKGNAKEGKARQRKQSLNMYYVPNLKQFLQRKAFLWILLGPLKILRHFLFEYHLLSRTDKPTINYSA